jgi:hypothetical protein
LNDNESSFTIRDGADIQPERIKEVYRVVPTVGISIEALRISEIP